MKAYLGIEYLGGEVDIMEYLQQDGIIIIWTLMVYIWFRRWLHLCAYKLYITKLCWQVTRQNWKN